MVYVQHSLSVTLYENLNAKDFLRLKMWLITICITFNMIL